MLGASLALEGPAEVQAAGEADIAADDALGLAVLVEAEAGLGGGHDVAVGVHLVAHAAGDEGAELALLEGAAGGHLGGGGAAADLIKEKRWLIWDGFPYWWSLPFIYFRFDLV